MISTLSGGTIIQNFQDNQIAITGSATTSKRVTFDVETNVPASTTVMLTVPSTSGIILTENGEQAISNKIINGNCNTITNISAGFTADATGTMSIGDIDKQNLGLPNTTLLGFNAGAALTTITEGDTFMGAGAGQSTTTGSGLIAIGAGALQSNSSGSNNTAIGYHALFSNTTGTPNTAIGKNALVNNTTGSGNIAIGSNTSTSITTGSGNIGLGNNTLANTNTFNNIAIGDSAMQNSVGGFLNVAIGSNALQNSGGTRNIVIGVTTLFANTGGLDNIAIGTNSATVGLTDNTMIMIGNNATATTHSISIGHLSNNSVPGTALINRQFMGRNTAIVGGTMFSVTTAELGTPLTNFTSQLINGIGGTATFTISPGTIFFPLSIIAYLTGATSTGSIIFTITNGATDLTTPMTLIPTPANNSVKQSIPDGTLVSVTNTMVVTVTTASDTATTFRVSVQGLLQQL